MRRSESAMGETRVSGSAPPMAGIIAAFVPPLLGGEALLEALLAPMGFIGIFGFLAYLATRKAVSGWFDDVIESW